MSSASRTHDDGGATRRQRLDATAHAVISCERCERLVHWRQDCANAGRPAYAGEKYWARALPGFGDPDASLLIVGLAPAAHGGNRTGRMFTGDRSGDFLFGALHRAGYASQMTSTHRDDGLVLNGAYVTAAVRCAPPMNKPTPDERDACAAFLTQELDALDNVRVIVALGAFALDALVRVLGKGEFTDYQKARPRFSHGAELALCDTNNGVGRTVLCSYHPSQRNVFTGRLSASDFDEIFARARALDV